MKSFRCFAVILSVACLVFCSAYALAEGGGKGDGFNIQADVQYNQDSGSFRIIADWESVKGASSYKVLGDSTEYPASGNHFEVNVGNMGKYTFHVVAYDASGAVIKQSDDFTVALPSPNGKYVGNGHFSLKCNKIAQANMQKWKLAETGSVNFVVYREPITASDGSKAVHYGYKVYGTGRVKNHDEISGGNMSHDIRGNGTLIVEGIFYGNNPPKDLGFGPCTMVLKFRVDYRPMRQKSRGPKNTSVITEWNWGGTYSLIGEPIAKKSYQADGGKAYGAIPRKITITMDKLSLKEPSECKIKTFGMP